MVGHGESTLVAGGVELCRCHLDLTESRQATRLDVSIEAWSTDEKQRQDTAWLTKQNRRYRPVCEKKVTSRCSNSGNRNFTV